VLIGLHVVAAGVLYALASQADEDTRASTPAWTMGLSVGRVAAALAVARVVVVWPASEAQAFGGLANVQAVACAAVAFVLLSVLTVLLIGSGGVRAAEVAARFALDALPGKQLGLDTAVQAGSVQSGAAGEELARMDREAHFYGAMDGALRLLRAEAAGLIVAGAVSAGAGAALHPDEYLGVVLTACLLSTGLMVACAIGGGAAVMGVGSALSGARDPGPAADPQARVAQAVLVAGLGCGVAGVAIGPPAWELVVTGLALAALGAGLLLRARGAPRQVGAGRGGGWALAASPQTLEALAAEAPDFPARVRAVVAARLGFDPGLPEMVVVSGEEVEAGRVRVLVRGLPVGEAPFRAGVWFREGAAEAGEACEGPDGRPGSWVTTRAEGEGALPGHDVLLWAVARHLVGATAFLVTPARSSVWAAAARRELMAAGLPSGMVSVSWVMAQARRLLDEGLPLPAPELLADAAMQDEAEQRRWLRRLAVRALVGRTRGATMARQLQPQARQVLGALGRGEVVGPRLDELRAAVVRASWRRHGWEAPMLLVESREREELAQLLADRVADLVIVAPEELPTALALSPLEVPGLGGE